MTYILIAAVLLIALVILAIVAGGKDR